MNAMVKVSSFIVTEVNVIFFNGSYFIGGFQPRGKLLKLVYGFWSHCLIY